VIAVAANARNTPRRVMPEELSVIICPSVSRRLNIRLCRRFVDVTSSPGAPTL
jgi:hypothetical protein